MTLMLKEHPSIRSDRFVLDNICVATHVLNFVVGRYIKHYLPAITYYQYYGTEK